MARSINGLALSDLHTSDHSYQELWRLRLALGWVILFGALIDLFALSWDIQWHSTVGRDRTLTAPHLFILGGISVMGITALLAVLIETAWARRNPALTKRGTAFAGLFNSSLGAYLVGYGALASAIAFPIDQYWHTLYGIDVSIWAPFHIMALTGLCISSLGVAYMLMEGASLAASGGAKKAASGGYIGVIVAFAALMGVFTFLLQPSLEMGYIAVGSVTFTVYPFMFGVLGTLVLIAAKRALPLHAVATRVALVYLFFGLVSYLIIPPLMTLLLGIEQQHLLPSAPTFSVVALEWQYGLIVAAILLDIAAWFARRKGWSLRMTKRITLAATLIGMSLAALLFPFFLVSAENRSIIPVSGKIVHGAIARGTQVGSDAVQQAGINMTTVLIVAVSLLLGLLGICIGNWLGAGIGKSMQKEEQE